MRIAYLSPLLPLPTGVAEYAHRLLPELAREHEVELFTDSGYRSIEAESFVTSGIRDLAERERQAPFDATIYQLGNDSRFHGAIYSALTGGSARTEGSAPSGASGLRVAVLHELMLHHMVRDLALREGGRKAYQEEMRYAYGASSALVGRSFLTQGLPPELWSFPLLERAVDSSHGVLVHSQAAKQRLLASRPQARIGVVPLIVNMDLEDTSLETWPSEAAAIEARRRLSVPEDAPLLGAFGHLSAQKRIDVLLRVFARLRERHPRARLLLAGRLSGEYDRERLLSGFGESVLAPGRVPSEEFLQLMACVDVAVNLRYPNGGESSGTLLQLFTLQRPVVVSDTGSFSELPDDCCAKVPVDAWEEDTLLAYLDRLLSDEALRRALGRNARHLALERHSPRAIARGYGDFLEELRECRPELEPREPPLAPSPRRDVFGTLVGAVSREVVDLGVGDDDGELLEAVARTLVSLDLDLPGAPERGRRGG